MFRGSSVKALLPESKLADLDPSAFPTMSEWALVILSILMAALALQQMGPNARRRR